MFPINTWFPRQPFLVLPQLQRSIRLARQLERHSPISLVQSGFSRFRPCSQSLEELHGSFSTTLYSPPDVKIPEITIPSYHEPSSFLKRGHKLQSIRVDSIESTRMDNIFNPPSKSRSTIFSKSRANRFPTCRIDRRGNDSCRFDGIGRLELTTFSTTLYSPPEVKIPEITIHTNRLQAWQIDNRRKYSCQFDRIDSNRQHFQPPCIPTGSQDPWNTWTFLVLKTWLQTSVDSYDSCRFNRIVSNRQHFQPTLKVQINYIF